MSYQNKFALGPSYLDRTDPKVNPFSEGSCTKIYGVPSSLPNKSGQTSTMKLVNFSHRDPLVVAANTVPSTAEKPVQLHHPAAASAMQATTNMTMWLQNNHPHLLEEMAQRGNHLNAGTLPISASSQVPGIPANFVAPPVPM
jgi:hypothetical protein